MSDTEENALTQDEIKNIVDALKSMKVKPKADTPQEFLKWMTKGKSTEVKTEHHDVDTKTESRSVSNISFPKIPFFSGSSQTDTTYDVWRYEVECLLSESYKSEVIHHAIRRSLRGEASRVIMHLGPGASIKAIIEKLDSIYGSVDEREDILAEFYSAHQKEDEECARWSCRLEDIISKAQQKGLVGHGESEEMLRTMFFKGLRPTLKDICGHFYDKCRTFDDLRSAVRKVELEHQPPSKEKKLATAKSATPTDSSVKRFDSLEAQIQQLTSEVKDMKYQYSYNPQIPQQYRSRRKTFQRGRRQGGYRGFSQAVRMPQSDIEPGASRYQRPDEEPACYKCGQKGHIAIGCRVRTDHRKAHLNYRKPTSGDKGLAEGQEVPRFQ